MQNAEKNEEEKTAPGGQDGERAHGQDDGERRDGQTKGGAMKIRVTHGQDGERRGGQYVMRRDEDQSTVYSDTAHEFETHNQQIWQCMSWEKTISNLIAQNWAWSFLELLCSWILIETKQS